MKRFLPYGCMLLAFIPLIGTLWWMTKIRVEPPLVQLASSLGDPAVTGPQLASALERAFGVKVRVSADGLVGENRIFLIEGSGFTGDAAVRPGGSESAAWLALFREGTPLENRRIVTSYLDGIGRALLAETGRESPRQPARLARRIQEVPPLGPEIGGLSMGERNLRQQVAPSEGMPLVLSTTPRREMVDQIGFLMVCLRGHDDDGKARVVELARALTAEESARERQGGGPAFHLPAPIAEFRSERSLTLSGAITPGQALTLYRQEARMQGKAVTMSFPGTRISSESAVVLAKVPQPDGVAVFFRTLAEKAQLRAVLPADSADLKLLDRLPLLDPTSPALPAGALVISGKLKSAGGVPDFGLVFDVTELAFEWRPGTL